MTRDCIEKMQKAGITLNVEKCELSKRKVHFLGHIIYVEGISPDPLRPTAEHMTSFLFQPLSHSLSLRC